ncbi:MAG TPA: N-acetylmuramoyl-L-alanine amidase [Solirubrobacteraceae bacterium]|nr:N-acetylmuramoyl-L-alanine amidase [Solirubrobacteraceae bacterium]
MASIGEVQLAFVHHTVNANDYTAADSADMVLAIARYHRDHNGWDDLGYNFLVDRFGQVFEGRAGGMDQAVIGAQAQGFNHVSTSVACLGTFGAEALPPAALEAVARVLAWKLAVHGVPVEGTVVVRSRGGSENRFAAGEDVSLPRIAGHRDGGKTECPGAALYGQLPDLRARAAAAAVTVPAPVANRPVLTARTASRRVRASGPGILVSGSTDPSRRVSVAVAHQQRDQRFRFVRRVDAQVDDAGAFSVRVRLSRLGVYRLLVSDGTDRVALLTRSVRRSR